MRQIRTSLLLLKFKLVTNYCFCGYWGLHLSYSYLSVLFPFCDISLTILLRVIVSNYYVSQHKVLIIKLSVIVLFYAVFSINDHITVGFSSDKSNTATVFFTSIF